MNLPVTWTENLIGNKTLNDPPRVHHAADWNTSFGSLFALKEAKYGASTSINFNLSSEHLHMAENLNVSMLFQLQVSFAKKILGHVGTACKTSQHAHLSMKNSKLLRNNENYCFRFFLLIIPRTSPFIIESIVLNTKILKSCAEN